MKKVRYILSTMCSGGGVESFFNNAADQLMQAGWRVELMVLGRYDADLIQYHREHGITVDCFTDGTKKDTFFSLLLRYPALKRFLRADPQPVTHVNTCSHSVVIVLHCLRVLGCRTRILHSHTSLRRSPNPFRRLRYAAVRWYTQKAATTMVACSRDAAGFLFPRKQIEAKHVTILYNGINIKRFAFDSSRRIVQRQQIGKEDALILGTVGRLEEEKNLEFLLDCFSAFQKICPSAFLLIIGEGSLHNRIILKAQALGLISSVNLTGQVRHVEDYLCAMDVFVMTSWHEGMPMALLEAQCSGLPCVVSEGVPPESCCFGNVKRLALNADSQAWADAFAQAAHVDTSREEAFRRLIGTVDAETMGKTLCRLYEAGTQQER